MDARAPPLAVLLTRGGPLRNVERGPAGGRAPSARPDLPDNGRGARPGGALLVRRGPRAGGDRRTARRLPRERLQLPPGTRLPGLRTPDDRPPRLPLPRVHAPRTNDRPCLDGR